MITIIFNEHGLSFVSFDLFSFNRNEIRRVYRLKRSWETISLWIRQGITISRFYSGGRNLQCRLI